MCFVHIITLPTLRVVLFVLLIYTPRASQTSSIIPMISHFIHDDKPYLMSHTLINFLEWRNEVVLWNDKLYKFNSFVYIILPNYTTLLPAQDSVEWIFAMECVSWLNYIVCWNFLKIHERSSFKFLKRFMCNK